MPCYDGSCLCNITPSHFAMAQQAYYANLKVVCGEFPIHVT